MSALRTSGLSSACFPDDKKHARIYPSAQIGYADVFLDGTLGVAFNASYNANYVQQDRIQTDWSYLANGRVIPYQVMWRPGPKFTNREAANLSVDYKASDKLTLSLRSNYSFYDVEYFNQYTFLIFGTTTSTRATADFDPHAHRGQSERDHRHPAAHPIFAPLCRHARMALRAQGRV